MPKVTKREWLTVKTDIWEFRRTYLNLKGEIVEVGSYEEAREYADKHGFKGIRIQYAGSKGK